MDADQSVRSERAAFNQAGRNGEARIDNGNRRVGQDGMTYNTVVEAIGEQDHATDVWHKDTR